MKKGFVLTDVLLYVALSSVLLVVIVSFLAVILESRVKNSVVAEIEQQGRVALNIILKEVREGEDIVNLSRGESDSTLLIDKGEEEIEFVFDETEGILWVVKGEEEIVLIGGEIRVEEVSFSNLSRSNSFGIVRAEITLSYRSESARVEYDYSKKFIGSASLR